MADKKTRSVKEEESRKTKELRSAPKRAGSTGKPAAAGRYSSQTGKKSS
jgi:hypothetical protein